MSRIEKIRDYLITHCNLSNYGNLLIDFLDEEAKNYSVEKIPLNPIVEQYLDGTSKRQETYQFSSRESYDNSLMQNLDNNGFYEEFCYIIESNNINGILPDIEGIEKIECLNCGSIQNTTQGKARYTIQIRIEYYYNPKNNIPSL